MQPPRGPLREMATIAAHHAVHCVLPLTLRLRRRLARCGYERLLVAYRLDFLRRHRAHPEGVAYRLVDAQPVARGVQAYRLQAPPGVRHRGGDTLLVRWRNADDEVQAMLRTMGWRGDEPVRLRTASSAFAPGRRRTVDVATALREIVDFRAALELGAVQAVPGQPPGVLGAWPRLQPRSYSVSGIAPAPQGEVVEILVSTVEQTLRSVDGSAATWPGRCSGHLARLRPGIDELHGWPLAFPLALQPRPAAPLLVVATGIAAAGPLFELRHRPPQGPVWLVCGLRQFDAGQPFTRRLLEHAAAHPALRLDIALSRADAPPAGDLPPNVPPNVHLHGRCRVQDVLQAEAARFDAHFREGGDTVVIGHTSMGDDVRAWLRRAFVAGGQSADEAQAAALLVQLEQQLRVQYSLSGR
ncbi:ferredoxin reductase domain-containing protein [Aquincola agrisoli]